MRYLRTNTAIRITVGPFLDKTDGITPEVALTATNEHLTLMVDDGNVPTLVLDANATASGGNNDLVHVTNDDAGFYDLELTAANLNYLGRAMLSINYATDHCPVFHEFTILPAVVYDAMILGTDLFQVDVTQLLGTAWLTPGTAGTPDVNAKLIGGTAQTGRDIGASVLLSSGTGTGQLDFTSGVVKASLVQILGSAIAGTASQISAAFTKFFDKASPTGTINSLPDAVAGATNGLFIAGTNAATTVTTALTTTFTGNLTGSVNSVTTGVTVTTNNDKTGYALSAAGVQAIWDALTSALTTVGSIGKLLVDNVNATISSRSSHSAADVWAVATRLLTAGTNIVLAKGVGVTGFNDLDAAGVRTAVGLASANLDTQLDALPTAAENADASWNEALAEHLGAGSTGEALNAAGAAGDPWVTALPGAYGAGSAGYIVGTNLNATVSSRASQTSLDTLDDYVDTEVTAIKAKTDQLTFTAANKVDATIQAAGDFAQGAADKVWDTAARTLTAFGFSVTVGTNNDKTGYALSAAGIQAVWDALTAALTAVGSIGKLLVDNINATISSRASQTSLDTLDDYVDTEIAAIKAKTDNLPIDPADQSAVEAAITAATGPLATAASIAALNNLSAAQVWDLTNGVETGLTPRQAMRLIAAATAGKLSGAATVTVTIRNAVADDANRIVATVDADGNRSAIVYTLG